MALTAPWDFGIRGVGVEKCALCCPQCRRTEKQAGTLNGDDLS